MSEQAPQQHEFQAEVAQLLHLVTHSLYSNPDIFLRELISNASDACDKLRYAAIDDDSLYGDDPELKVRITLDADAKTLTIIDNGIGMNEADAIDNLGTIAKSGTKAFLEQLEANKKGDAGLIGQFGVGFYSSFIVADKVTVESRKAGEAADKAIRWESGGTGAFTITPITREQRGTAITLHLTEEHESYLETHKLKQLVSKYSDHISLPIQMYKQEWVEGEQDDEGNKAPGEMVTTDEWETINKASALWTRDKSDITDEEYTEFYKNLSYAMDEPLTWTHNRVEGNQQYTQLLYIPSKAPFDLYHREQQHGLKLYVKRVFIMDDAEQLLPMYLRFVKGVIDSSDLPLNVSREILQESRDVKSIREGNARRVLVMLDKLAKSEEAADQEKYAAFYSEFGAVLKEGLGEDMKNQERIAKLLRFASIGSDTQDKSLEQYKADMKDGQKAIYYLTADSLAAAKNSPQLELFKKKGIDVLFLTDRVDEWAMSFLTQFDGTPLQNIAKGAVDLGELQDEAEKEAAEKASEAMKPVVEKLETTLKDRAKNVRVSTRLVDSPACIVVGDGEMTPQMVQMLKSMGQDVPDIKPTLEINAEHPLVKKLEGSEQFDDLAQVIFDQAMLAEGAALEDPAGYLKRVNTLLMK